MIVCFYYKKLWSKCKKLWSNKFIFGYWVSNGSIKIRISKCAPVKVISHIVDLEKLFPDELKDDHIEAKFYRDIKIYWVLILLNLFVVYFCMGFIFYFWLSFFPLFSYLKLITPFFCAINNNFSHQCLIKCYFTFFLYFFFL